MKNLKVKMEKVWSQYGDVLAVPHHHGVTEFCTKNRIYLDLLDGDPKKLNALRLRGYLHAPSTFGTPVQYKHFYKAEVAFRAEAEREVLLDLAAQESDWKNPGWQVLRAMIYRSADMTDQAMDAAWQAYRFQPDETALAAMLGRLAVESGNRQVFRAYADGLTERQRNEVSIQGILERGEDRVQSLPAPPLDTEAIAFSPPLESCQSADFDGLSQRMTAAFGRRIQDMFALRDYDGVLHATAAMSDGRYGGPSQILAYRALSMLRAGEMGTAVRIARAASLRPLSDDISLWALIETAYRSRNGDLLWRYFDIPLTKAQRQRHIDLTARCFEFVTEEHLFDRLAGELLTFEGRGEKQAQRRERARVSCATADVKSRLDAHFSRKPQAEEAPAIRATSQTRVVR